MAVGFAAEAVAAGKAERRRNATAGMAGHEQVVGALVGIGVAHQAPLGANRAERGEAARDQLVGINLMTRVPDQAVAAEVEDAMQGEAEFHHAEVRGEVGGPGRGNFAERPPHLRGKLLQFVHREPLQVARRKDARQDVGHGEGCSVRACLRQGVNDRG